MKYKDKDAWKEFEDKNSDPYWSGVVRYAKKWAELMEEAMDNGEKIADIADKLSHEADTEGITGFMYGCAVSSLSEHWEHGEELRRWHNINTQIGTEGEKANESGSVLNPALLNIGKKE